jgi:hypothetical protein
MNVMKRLKDKIQITIGIIAAVVLLIEYMLSDKKDD